MRRRRLVASAGVVAAAVGLWERQVLAGLETGSDPDTDERLAFPPELVHSLVMPDGARLHVEECRGGRPVVLLHGHGANLGIFAPLATRLCAAGQRVIAFDQRGFGRSSAMEEAFGFDGLIDDLATVLEALDLRDAVVVGHSMGGAVALGLAVGRPEVVNARVAALVLINSAARGPADRLLLRARATMLDWRVIERVGRHPRHGLVLTRANFGPTAHRSHVVGVRAVGFESPAALRRGSPEDCSASICVTSWPESRSPCSSWPAQPTGSCRSASRSGSPTPSPARCWRCSVVQGTCSRWSAPNRSRRRCCDSSMTWTGRQARDHPLSLLLRPERPLRRRASLVAGAPRRSCGSGSTRAAAS